MRQLYRQHDCLHHCFRLASDHLQIIKKQAKERLVFFYLNKITFQNQVGTYTFRSIQLLAIQSVHKLVVVQVFSGGQICLQWSMASLEKICLRLLTIEILEL